MPVDRTATKNNLKLSCPHCGKSNMRATDKTQYGVKAEYPEPAYRCERCGLVILWNYFGMLPRESKYMVVKPVPECKFSCCNKNQTWEELEEKYKNPKKWRWKDDE
ncbi:MAG: hypothetical protein ACLFVB_10665 [Thermoplasmata archaeon]